MIEISKLNAIEFQKTQEDETYVPQSSCAFYLARYGSHAA